jgi:hypothetical protein
MHVIGEKTSERLDVIPAQYWVIWLVDKRARLQDPRTMALLYSSRGLRLVSARYEAEGLRTLVNLQ